MDPDKSSVVPKPVAVGAVSCFPRILEGALTSSVGHFCGLVWGVVLKAWPRACSSPCQLLCKYLIPALNPFQLKLAKMDSLICKWTLTNPEGIYSKDTGDVTYKWSSKEIREYFFLHTLCVYLCLSHLLHSSFSVNLLCLLISLLHDAPEFSSPCETCLEMMDSPLILIPNS